MLLSIVIPVYETETYLRRCLESLVVQGLDPSDYEIIVVDDGSKDGSLGIAEAFATEHPNVLVLSQANAGPGAARNTGVGRARGRFVYFVDSDDHVAPEILADIVSLMVRERLDVAAFRHVDVRPDQVVPEPILPVMSEVRVMTGVEYIAEHGYTVGVWSYVFDRRFLLGVGILFEVGRILEDLVFTSTVVAASRRLVYLPVDVYRYVKKRPGSIMEMRGTASTVRVTTDWEHAIAGLDSLRREWAARGSAPVEFLDRLAATEQSFIFFLIARFIRSEVPLAPILTDALEHFRSLGMYPLDRFPNGTYRGRARYHALTIVFNRSYLLRPFARAVRLAGRSRRMLGPIVLP